MAKETPENDAGWRLDNSYARLPKTFFSILNPTPVKSPQLIILNIPLAASLGLNSRELQSAGGVAALAGNIVPAGALPLAQAYAGHQFGHFTMLGDGRAILLGEQLTPRGERFDIQLKGAGRTPYSRGGDGRAALGPMLREYIISEAMHALGIATNRSLAVVTTGEPVIRETVLPGAVLARVAASHLRVGTFQYASARGNPGDLRSLADYTLWRHFPAAEHSDNRYLALLRSVIARQAKLVAGWQLVGFIHGVMNTDNMALSGETIDYGPCALMDAYDPETVFSSIDVTGRYAYGNQPHIAGWNLARFAETLLPLLHPDETQAVSLAQDALSTYPDSYNANWLAGMRAKLGIFNAEPGDKDLIEDLLDIMKEKRADYTNTFRGLTTGDQRETALFGAGEFTRWREKWQARLGRQPQTADAANKLMRSSNPAVIPRNHRVEAALESAVKHGDHTVMAKLLDTLSQPYAYSAEQDEYSQPPAPAACPYKTFCGT